MAGGFSTPDNHDDKGLTPKAAASRSGYVGPLIRDRIRELRRVRAGDLIPNPRNWRRHPKAQTEALRGLLTEIGYADALLAQELPDGRLMLIDGYLRAETTPESAVPVLVLDVTDAEADKLLLTLDPLAAMAESDTERIEALLQTVRTDDQAVEGLLRRTAGAAAVEPTPSAGRTSGADRPGRRTAKEAGHRDRAALADWKPPAAVRRRDPR